MIQFNLLPSVKAEYIKAQKTQRTVMVISALITAVAMFIFILLIVINIVQKHVLNGLASDVKQNSTKLENTKNLNQILTIQNQLQALPGLDKSLQKPLASLMFGVNGGTGYLGQITPANVSINDLSINFTAHTMSINGGAPSLDYINIYVDTLKYTTYSTANGSVKNAKAFSNVVLTSFGTATGKASFAVTLSYSPDIFDASKTVSLTVPVKVTSGSIVEEPGANSSGQSPFQQSSP